MKLVAENFVPVALNTDRLPDTEAGKFFRALMQKWPQGLWAVTPEGKTLAFHYHKARSGESYTQAQLRWRDDTVTMIRDAIRDAGPMTAREVKVKPDPFADRGRGVAGDGSVRLAVSVIELQAGRQYGPPVVDSIRLTAEQWAAFSPPEAVEGRQWALPVEVARRFAPALSPMTDPIFSPTPDDVKNTKMAAKVFRVEGGIAIIRYKGLWESAHNRDGDPKLPIRTGAGGEAVGVYDTRAGKMKSLAWLLSGSYTRTVNHPQSTAAVIEWADGSEK